MKQQLFTPASKRQARARVGISGPSGSGKTMWSLLWADQLAGEGRVALIDTERGSASLYADAFKFDVLNLTPPYHPDRLVEALNAASAAGYAVVIVDSLTHFWSGQGGVLEIVDAASARFKGNSHAAWQVGSPIQQRMVDALLAFNGHLIATMRAKTEWVMEQGPNGKTTPRKVGLAPQQRADIEFEFTLFLELDHQHRAVVGKTRFADMADKVYNPEEAVQAAQRFADWLVKGDSTEVVKPEPQVVIDPFDHVGATRAAITELSDDQRDTLKAFWREEGYPPLDRLTAPQAQAIRDYIAMLNTPIIEPAPVDEVIAPAVTNKRRGRAPIPLAEDDLADAF